MISKQNITLSLPKDLLHKARIFADERETSVSGLVVDLLTELMTKHEQYKVAKQEHLAILSQSMNLGTNGERNWSRESLHDR